MSVERKVEEPSLNQLKRDIEPDRLFDYLEKNNGLDISQHRSFRAKNGELRITAGVRNLAVTDFLTQHMNMRWPEAKTLLNRLYDDQLASKPFIREKHSKEHWKAFQKVLPLWREEIREQRLNCRDRYIVATREVAKNHRTRTHDIRSDRRLTRDEKNQFLSVAIFERLKKTNQIKELYQGERLQLKVESRTPYKKLYERFINEKGILTMGSAEIRGLAEQQLEDKRNKRNMPSFNNSISAGDDKKEQKISFKERISFTRLIANQLEKRNRTSAVGEVNKRLELQDFYTQSKGKGTVHYLDKATQKTHFVDKGNSIQLRRNAIKQESVGVALELAVAKFGSTLNIKGNAAFKEMAIAAAIEKKMDIQFTDKDMNMRMSELKISQEQTATADTIPAQEAATATADTTPAQEAATETADTTPAQEAATATADTTPAQEAATETADTTPAQEAATATPDTAPAQEAATAVADTAPAQELTEEQITKFAEMNDLTVDNYKGLMQRFMRNQDDDYKSQYLEILKKGVDPKDARDATEYHYIKQEQVASIGQKTFASLSDEEKVLVIADNDSKGVNPELFDQWKDEDGFTVEKAQNFAVKQEEIIDKVHGTDTEQQQQNHGME